MSELSDQAQSLLEAGRAGHEPRDEDRERVLRGVLVRAGVVTTLAAHSASASSAAGGSASIAGAASATSLAGLGAKLVLGLALAGSAGAGLYHYVQPHASEQPLPPPALSGHFASQSAPPAFAEPGLPPRLAEPDRPSSAASSARVGGTAPTSRAEVRANGLPEAAAPAVPEAAPTGEMSAPRASSIAAFPELGAPAASKSAVAAPKSSAPGAVLSAEARALADAQRALREGRNGEALSRIEQQESQFASGELGQERRAAKIVALCALGRVSEARALAVRFLADSPRSPLAARIRATCAGP